MEHRIKSHASGRGRRGFTLVEVLVVVAIIGLLASMAIPAYKRAVLRSKRNAAVHDLRVFRDAMHRYAGDSGRFPRSEEFDRATLAPLGRNALPVPEKVTRLLKDRQLDLYFPWNLFSDPLTPTTWTMPDGFFAIATLAYDPSIRFIVTDDTIYLYIDHYVTLIRDN